jgi:hypothetical protein
MNWMKYNGTSKKKTYFTIDIVQFSEKIITKCFLFIGALSISVLLISNLGMITKRLNNKNKKFETK